MGEEKETIPESRRDDEDTCEQHADRPVHTQVRISKPFFDDENAVPIPAGPIL
jgi:hypothetical protein